MKCKWYQFHKWVEVNQVISRTYLDETYDSFYPSHRICEKCSTIQEFLYDSQGGHWRNISVQETTILNKYLVKEGGKYVIRNHKKAVPPREE